MTDAHPRHRTAAASDPFVAPRRSAASPSLSIVIPAYNESERLPALLESLVPLVGLHDAEVIVVDDGSDDDTAAIAERALHRAPLSTVRRLPTNRGKGRALRDGIAHARGATIVFMDADSATDLRCLPRLLAALEGADVAVGSRSHPESVVQSARLHRKLLGAVFNRLVRQLTGLRLRDTQCGFKAFRAPAATLLFGMAEVDGFAIDVEILSNADRLGLRIVEVPVRWHHVPGSKVDALSDSLRMTIAATRAARFPRHQPLSALRVRGVVDGHLDDSLRSLGEGAIVVDADDTADVLGVRAVSSPALADDLRGRGWAVESIVLDSVGLIRSVRHGRAAVSIRP